ncbi:MAG: hypothetical protein RL662_1553 [Bacteroidota bacterium]|jgi:hypothetical protein
MKNILSYILVLTALLLTSCSSESPVSDIVEPNNSLRKVTFSIKGLATQANEMSLKSSSLQGLNIQHLEYWVYKTVDVEASYLTEKPVSHAILKKEDFDKNIVLELPDNDYTVLCYAADTVVKVANVANRTPYVEAVGIKSQMFYAKQKFSISEQNPNINATIVLRRIVGKIEIVIEDLDKLPADVKSITPVIAGRSGISGAPGMAVGPYQTNLINGDVFVGGGKVLPTIPRSQFSSINKDNPISFYMLPSVYNSEFRPGSVSMGNLYIQGARDENFYILDMEKSLLEQEPNVLFMRRVGKFNVEANQVTRYTGKIGSLGDNGMSIIEDNSAWDELSYEVEK